MKFKKGTYYIDVDSRDTIQFLGNVMNKGEEVANVRVIDDPEDVWGSVETTTNCMWSTMNNCTWEEHPTYNTPLWRAMNGDNND